MPDHTPHTPAPRRNGGRIGSIVAGTVAAILAIGFIAAGALLLWGDSEKDAQGYLSTGKDRYAASTYALASDNLDIDLDGAGWIMDRDDLGKVRLKVESSAGKPVFVGIARTSDVSDYLRGTAYTAVTDVDYSPFHASYREHGGGGRPALPADQDFWAASAQGSGDADGRLGSRGRRLVDRRHERRRLRAASTPTSAPEPRSRSSARSAGSRSAARW